MLRFVVRPESFDYNGKNSNIAVITRSLLGTVFPTNPPYFPLISQIKCVGPYRTFVNFSFNILSLRMTVVSVMLMFSVNTKC